MLNIYISFTYRIPESYTLRPFHSRKGIKWVEEKTNNFKQALKIQAYGFKHTCHTLWDFMQPFERRLCVAHVGSCWYMTIRRRSMCFQVIVFKNFVNQEFLGSSLPLCGKFP